MSLRLSGGSRRLLGGSLRQSTLGRARVSSRVYDQCHDQCWGREVPSCGSECRKIDAMQDTRAAPRLPTSAPYTVAPIASLIL